MEGPASFSAQAAALLRKNITFQKRNLKTNIHLVASPIFFCVLLVIIQSLVDNEVDKPSNRCGCTCINTKSDGSFEKSVCGIQYSTLDQASTCSIPSPPEWPALLQVPCNEYRASRTDSCIATQSCAATILYTGANRTLAERLAGNLFTMASPSNISYYLDVLSNLLPGTDTDTREEEFIEPAFLSDRPLYIIQPQCAANFSLSIPIQMASKTFQQGNLSISVRLTTSVSNAYLQFLKGGNVKMQLEFVKEMPKSGQKMVFDLASLVGTLFFKWAIEVLFPILLTYLVYEKQEKLKIMMKMHGLGDGPYWIISYAYFFSISAVYIFLFVVFGSVTGLRFFRVNDYSIQLVFYVIYINLQIALAFLAATAFSHVKTAQVLSYKYMFGSGLLAGYLFQNFVEDLSFPRHWLLFMEIFPAFSLYRGLYEFSVFAFTGSQMGTSGMRWSDLNNSENGMREVLIIMSIEWVILLPLAYYLEQLTSFGGAIQRDHLSFLHCFRKKPSASSRNPSLQRHGSNVSVDMEKPDVLQERYIVEQLLLEPSTRHAIICDNLKKVYPGEDGNPDKIAVQGLSLALPRGECFGMLGPNGAGKTTFISMMIGLTKPTSGSAYVHGLDLLSDMDKIYTSMGVCPQHNMLWEMLTGREHLLFYGRLKNLKGDALQQAVEESLKSVNLYYGGVGDKQVRKYSGGMKRRLSVAISLIGDPKVIYMDEPSTGLDPASRNNLWNVMRRAKQDRAIILTTHSMEEAEVLCDRLGIFVDGSLQCIGSPAELKCRYGGSYVFTMTTSTDDEHEVEKLVRQLSPNANKIYHISGTQKFEFPKHDVRIADVFRAVENAKKKFTIQAWGLANTTLEDVFIKVATGAQSSNM